MKRRVYLCCSSNIIVLPKTQEKKIKHDENATSERRQCSDDICLDIGSHIEQENRPKLVYYEEEELRVCLSLFQKNSEKQDALGLRSTDSSECTPVWNKEKLGGRLTRRKLKKRKKMEEVSLCLSVFLLSKIFRNFKKNQEELGKWSTDSGECK